MAQVPSQEALAQRVGYAATTVKQIDQDERRPSHDMAARLVEAPGVSMPATAWAEGRAMSFEQAVGYSLATVVTVRPL